MGSLDHSENRQRGTMFGICTQIPDAVRKMTQKQKAQLLRRIGGIVPLVAEIKVRAYYHIEKRP
jgi:hypothetical protein